MNFEMEETSEQTIARVLGTYELGRKLRTLRLRKKIALSDLARHTGLSVSMLSQLETGKLIPTLATLARIALVFDVELEYFFGTKRNRRHFAVIRKNERMRFPERSDLPDPSYFFECLAFTTQGKLFEAYIAEFPPGEARQTIAHQHDGAELLYVLEGAIVIHFEGEDHTLAAGDSVYFDATEAHSYRASGAQAARAIVITSPPRV